VHPKDVLTFGGFLLLGGRLGHLHGQRRLFLTGIAAFTAASLGCGLSNSQELLVAMRAVVHDRRSPGPRSPREHGRLAYERLLDSGREPLAALNGGYQAAFLLGAVFVVASAVVTAVLLKATAAMAHPEAEPATEAA
jgi:MFS family permease